jgi:hypothetical protein
VASGEGGAGAPSCWRPAARAQEEEAARVGGLPAPSGKPETINCFCLIPTKSLHEYL